MSCVTHKEVKCLLKVWGDLYKRQYNQRGGCSSTYAACEVLRLGIISRGTNPSPEFKVPRPVEVINNLLDDLPLHQQKVIKIRYVDAEDWTDSDEITRLFGSGDFRRALNKAELAIMRLI
jgi:hypothetical protein